MNNKQAECRARVASDLVGLAGEGVGPYQEVSSSSENLSSENSP